MRVRVALPITKPLCRGGYIVGTDGERTWVKFKYERLPMFCHCCGLLGHDLRHCASHFAEEKKGGGVEYQYEDWLKALGSHPRALQKHDKDRTYGSHGDSVDEQQPEMVDSAAIIVLTAENQRESITDEIGNDEIHGSIYPDGSGDCFRESKKKNGTVMGSVTPISEDNVDNINSKISADVCPNLTDATVVQELGLDGLVTTKPKSMWVRLTRMDCGLGGTARAPSLPTLGKRVHA